AAGRTLGGVSQNFFARSNRRFPSSPAEQVAEILRPGSVEDDMGRHDSIFKRLLREFFSDLLRLAVPELATKLDLARPVLVDKEFFTAGGQRREVDLLFRVSFLADEGVLLVHIEVEARARRGMARRLWLYRNQIQAAHESHVLSIVLYLARGPRGIQWR